jgi:hypothetical protein
MQLVIDQLTGRILCTFFGSGQIHDFRLFKASQVRFAQSQVCLADKGYQGLENQHALVVQKSLEHLARREY